MGSVEGFGDVVVEEEGFNACLEVVAWQFVEVGEKVGLKESKSVTRKRKRKRKRGKRNPGVDGRRGGIETLLEIDGEEIKLLKGPNDS